MRERVYELINPPTPRRDSPRADRSLKRQRILATALTLFASRGFQHVSMDRVAEQAKVAKGTLYLYFPSKEALYMGVINGGFEEMSDYYTRAVREESASSPVEKLSRALSATLQFYSDHREFLRLIYQNEPRLNPARGKLINKWRERGLNFFQWIISEGVNSGVFWRTDPKLLLPAINGMIYAVLQLGDVQRPIDQIAQELVRIVLHGVALPEPRGTGRVQSGKPRA